MLFLHYFDYQEYAPAPGPGNGNKKYIVWAKETEHIATYDFEREVFIDGHTKAEIKDVVYWADLPTMPVLVHNANKEL